MSSPNIIVDCSAVPQFPVRSVVKRSVELTIFEDDASQVRIISPTKHVSFELSYASQGDSEKESFELFHDARFGSSEPYGGVFYFTDVRQSSAEFKVRFATQEVQYECTGPRTWAWSVKLVVVAY